MPFLARILIYPIKSMQPVDTAAARLLRSGALEHDRALALFDTNGKVVNGKRTPLIHSIRMRFDSMIRRVDVSMADGSRLSNFHVDRERIALEQWLSEMFGFAVVVRENNTAGFPDDTDSPGPTLISTATLREVASWFGITLEQARLRFRTNLEIDGVEPFWEDRLYGPAETVKPFSIGDVTLHGNNPCQRCAVPPRDPMTGENTVNFTKTFIARRTASLPSWAERSRFNHFYRLAINTRMPVDQHGKILRVADTVSLDSSALRASEATAQ